MPCRDDRDNYSYNQNDVSNAEVSTEHRIRAELEPLLCEACSLLENAHVLSKATPELLAWFKKHEKCEEDRVRLEAAQKLSERERRLLGISLENLSAKLAAKKGPFNRK